MVREPRRGRKQNANQLLFFFSFRRLMFRLFSRFLIQEFRWGSRRTENAAALIEFSYQSLTAISQSILRRSLSSLSLLLAVLQFPFLNLALHSPLCCAPNVNIFTSPPRSRRAGRINPFPKIRRKKGRRRNVDLENSKKYANWQDKQRNLLPVVNMNSRSEGTRTLVLSSSERKAKQPHPSNMSLSPSFSP